MFSDINSGNELINIHRFNRIIMSLIVSNISKSYSNHKALKGVSVEINENGIVGLLGPNGAGKSTLMKIIVGYLTSYEGIVTIDGLTNSTDQENYRKLIGYLPENNPLYTDMYVAEYLDFIANSNGIADKKMRIEEVIKQVGLTKERSKKIGALSKGYRQRVGLASALLPNPRVLILDEPTTGLDPLQIIEIRDLIKSVAQEKIVILSTHIMQEVQALCNRVLIIKDGNIVADEAVQNLNSLVNNREAVVTVEFEKDIDAELLKAISSITSIKEIAPRTLSISTPENIDIRADLFKFAVENGVVILSSNRKEVSMEEIFQELAG